MLVSFSVSNFRSFGEEVTLNMVASKRLAADHPNHVIQLPDGRHLLRVAVLYGANAAGKSNLIKAMRFAQSVIDDSSFRSATPFKFDRRISEQPSSFEFRFLIDENIFVYGFDVKRKHIVSEWLSVLKGNDDHLIFERNFHGKTSIEKKTVNRFFSSYDERMDSTLDILCRIELNPDQLFLNRASSIPESAQGKTLSSIIQWLKTDLVTSGPEFENSCQTLDRLDSDETFRKFCTKFLSNVGTGVIDLEVVKGSRTATDFEREYAARYSEYLHGWNCSGYSDARLDPDNPDSVVTRTLLSTHLRDGDETTLAFSEESDGTQHLLELMEFIFPSKSHTRTVVIDELDRSLHPLICWEFIHFFSESCPGARRQLIVTTHEAHLLDQDLLRRDEYWFVEKDPKHQSHLVSLSDFKIRNDLKVQKGYLHGRFGAIPIIGGMDSLERLLNCENPEEVDAAQETSS